jgi:hypothetical protein
MTNTKRVVVFDLDETLGYFTEYGVFYELLCNYKKIALQQRQYVFNKLLDLFSEVLRPNIFSVLKYLVTKKKNGMCSEVIIYTNNQGPKDWINLIKGYIHSKLNYNLFDRVIGAFKINGRVEEICRTTNDKTKGDLIRCAKLPKKTHICFIDDVYYESMDDVYYIKLTPYIYNISINVMVNRFLTSDFASELGIDHTNSQLYVRYMRRGITRYNYEYRVKNEDEFEMDKIVTKQLMIFLQRFFQNKL